jgi:general secretion pathway protein H
MKPIRRHANGFTLLEMLVVVVIAAILVSLAAVSIGSNPRRNLDEEGQRLAQLFESANDEAHLRAHLWAWQPGSDGYRFLERRDGVWVTRTERPFAPRKWPNEFRSFAIRVRGSTQSLDQLQFGGESIEPPTVVILQGEDQSVSIVGSGDGRYEAH